MKKSLDNAKVGLQEMFEATAKSKFSWRDLDSHTLNIMVADRDDGSGYLVMGCDFQTGIIYIIEEGESDEQDN